MYNITLKSVHANIVAVEKQIHITYSECVYSLRYPSHNVHVPYCHLWPVKLYNILPHYIINDTILEKILLNIQCEVWFHLSTSVWNISRSKKNWARYDQKVYWSSWKINIILFRYQWKLSFHNWFSKNTQISNFIKICPVGAKLLQEDGRTNRHDEANSYLLQFYKHT